MSRFASSASAFLFAALLVAAAVLAACGGSGGDGPQSGPSPTSVAVVEVQGVFREFIDSWNREDADAFLALWTDEGLVSSLGDEDASAEQVADDVRRFIGSFALGNASFLETSVDGDTAKLDVQFTVQTEYTRSIFTLVRRDGAWLIDGEEANLDIRVPAGAKRLDVVMNEFSFEADTSGLTSTAGVVAITARNVGRREHEMGVVRVDEGVDLLQALRSEPVAGADPPGLTFVGGGPIDATGVIVFAFSEFTPGRYAFVCMLPDTNEGPDGTPHALKGMVREFTID